MKNIFKIALAIFATSHMPKAFALSEFLSEKFIKRMQIEISVRQKTEQALRVLKSKMIEDQQSYEDAILASYDIPLEDYECWIRFTRADFFEGYGHYGHLFRTLSTCNRDRALLIQKGKEITRAEREIINTKNELERQFLRDVDELHENAQKLENDLIKAQGLEITEDERNQLIAKLEKNISEMRVLSALNAAQSGFAGYNQAIA